MNYNGAGVLDFVLLGIDHIEEVEDTAWVCGYTIIRPGQEVELVHTPGLLPLCTKMPETLKYGTQQLTSERNIKLSRKNRILYSPARDLGGHAI